MCELGDCICVGIRMVFVCVSNDCVYLDWTYYVIIVVDVVVVFVLSAVVSQHM